MARLAGIDIDSTHVRVAHIRSSYRRVAIEHLIEVPIKDGDEVAAIREAMGADRPDAIAVALTGEKVLYRRVELPRTAQRELEAVLEYEIESSIPFELEGAVYDKRILQTATTTGAGVQIFAAVARIPDVEAQIALVKEATSREADIVDTGSLALANLVSVVPELTPPSAVGASTPIGILDLGSLRTELLVIDRGEAAFARTLSRGTYESEAVLRELRQSLSAWRAGGGAALAGIYLTGTGVGVARAEEILAARLGVPVKRLPGMQVDLVKPTDAEKLPLFAKAIGLALGTSGRSKSLNLRQGPLEAARSFVFLREKAPLLTGLGVVIAVSFIFSVVAERRALSSERELLDEQLKTTTREAFGEETTDMARAQELLDKGPSADDDPLPKADAFDVMVQLSKSVPEDVIHDVAEIDVSRGHAIIQGLIPTGANATEAVQKISDGMKENPCMKDVKVPKNTTFGQDKQKYILELDIRCEEKKDPKKSAATPATTGAPKE